MFVIFFPYEFFLFQDGNNLGQKQTPYVRCCFTHCFLMVWLVDVSVKMQLAPLSPSG